MAKRKNAVKPTVKTKRKRGRPVSNTRPTNKAAVRAKGAKSLKVRLKTKSKRSTIKREPSKPNSRKVSTRKTVVKSIKQAPIINKKQGRPAKSKAVKSNKAIQITQKKIANA